MCYRARRECVCGNGDQLTGRQGTDGNPLLRGWWVGCCTVSNNLTPKKKMKVRWWHIVLIAFFVVLFLFLAYWQWTRFRSGSGTFQNLGYAFQWPLFAVFVVYAYRTAMRYENERIDAENEALEQGTEPGHYQAPQRATGSGKSAQAEKRQPVTKIDEDFLPPRPQIDVETFNAMNTQRRRRGTEEEN